MFLFLLYSLATFGAIIIPLMAYANWSVKRPERKAQQRANSAQLFAFFKWPEPLGKPWPPFPGRPWTIVDRRPKDQRGVGYSK